MTKRVKDSVCCIELCSIELKLEILKNLCSKDLAKLECVNSALQQLLNNNDWWWKNKCFSDDLWLKIWKNNLYTLCVRIQLIHNKKMCIHVDYYDDKVWKQFCNQVKDAADILNLVEKLPEGCTWKEVYNLWDVAEKHEQAYLKFMFARDVYHKDIKSFASFVSYLHTSNLIETMRKKSRVVAWDDIRQPVYGYDNLFQKLLDVERNSEQDLDFLDGLVEQGNEFQDLESNWEPKWEPYWDFE